MLCEKKWTFTNSTIAIRMDLWYNYICQNLEYFVELSTVSKSSPLLTLGKFILWNCFDNARSLGLGK